MKLRILIAGLVIWVAAFAAEAGGDLFQRATTLVRAGNLEEAIKVYQRVATEFASDRALAAKALVAEARCYETLGQDKATRLYEQVAREYHDQPDQAAAANARLAALRQGEHPAVPATMTQRRIELPDSGVFVSAFDETDGQHIVFRDSATGVLMMSDLAGSRKRIVFNPKERNIANFILSRDSSMVVMVLTKPDSTKNLAIVRTDGTGLRELPGEWSGSPPCDPELSWDNRYVLYCQRQSSGTIQLVRFSVTDGEIRKIRESDGVGYRFSPDGRFIAYHNSKGTVVIPSQGGEPQLVTGNDYHFYDWTRDGRYLIGQVTGGGTRALELLPIKDGQLAGEPVIVRYGNFAGGRTTASGAFIYAATPQGGQYTPWLGKLDTNNGSLGWEKLNLTGASALPHFPTWSPDSTQFAYVTSNSAAGQYLADIRVRTIASGEERELYRSDLFTVCLWSANHPSLFCVQDLQNPQNSALSISTDTGRAEPINAVPGLDGTPIVLADDDRTVYLGSSTRGLMRWEIGAAQLNTVFENPNVNQGRMSLSSASPDARWVSQWVKGTVEIRPMSGGDWRPLISLIPLTQVAFTPDGNWFVYHHKDAAGKDGLFRVATSGGQPERLGDFPAETIEGYMWISPNGQRVIADVLKSQNELWMLQDFEPKQEAAKSVLSSKTTQPK